MKTAKQGNECIFIGYPQEMAFNPTEKDTHIVVANYHESKATVLFHYTDWEYKRARKAFEEDMGSASLIGVWKVKKRKT